MARTFHALAYDIIGKVEGSKPPLADHATDDLAFTNLIKQILKDLVQTLTEVSRAIIQWFAHFLVEPKTEWDFQDEARLLQPPGEAGSANPSGREGQELRRTADRQLAIRKRHRLRIRARLRAQDR